MQGKITIVVVGYNRADAMERVLHSLSRAQYDYTDIRLVVSIDHSGNEAVVHTAEAFEWKYGEKEVIYRPERLGLRKHIISCGDMTEKYDTVMILEDDIYVSPDFYNYAMQTLEKYGDHPQIAGIALNTKRELLESVYPFFPLRTGYDIYFQQFGTGVCGQRLKNGMKNIRPCRFIEMCCRRSRITRILPGQNSIRPILWIRENILYTAMIH